MIRITVSTCGLKKQPRGQPLYPSALVSVSIGFFLCIGLQCFGSSSSKVVTFPYKCSMQSTLCQLPAPAGKSQLFSTSAVSTQSTFWQLQLESRNFSVACAVDFGSSGSKISVQVSFSVQMWYTKYILAAPGKAAGRLVGFGVAATELGIVGYRFGPCKYMIPRSWLATTTWT